MGRQAPQMDADRKGLICVQLHPSTAYDGPNIVLCAVLLPYSSTASSTQPGSVDGLLPANTIRRVLGNGKFVASARL